MDCATDDTKCTYSLDQTYQAGDTTDVTATIKYIVGTDKSLDGTTITLVHGTTMYTRGTILGFHGYGLFISMVTVSVFRKLGSSFLDLFLSRLSVEISMINFMFAFSRVFNTFYTPKGSKCIRLGNKNLKYN